MLIFSWIPFKCTYQQQSESRLRATETALDREKQKTDGVSRLSGARGRAMSGAGGQGTAQRGKLGQWLWG